MTLMLNLSEEMERRLESEAERRGLPAPELALQLIQTALRLDSEMQKRVNQPSLDLYGFDLNLARRSAHVR